MFYGHHAIMPVKIPFRTLGNVLSYFSLHCFSGAKMADTKKVFLVIDGQRADESGGTAVFRE
jgi:hypothetical protein